MNNIENKIHSIVPYVPFGVLRGIAHEGKSTLKKLEKLEGGILFFDISSFTPLTSALMKNGSRGAEQLQEILKNYYDKMIDIVQDYGGSVYQFAGDSALASFEKEKDETPEETVFRVVSCTEKMRRIIPKLDKIETNDKTFHLETKFSVAYGSFFQLVIGSPQSFYNASITGQPVFEATQGEKVAKANDFIITKEVADLLGNKAEILENEGVIKVASMANLHQGKPIDTSQIDLTSNKLFEKVSHFVSPALLDKILLGASTFIAEMREVTSVFISFGDFEFEKNPSESVELLNIFYTHVQKISQQYGGLLVQTDFADKGNVFLILFGAPVAIEQKEIMAVRFALKVLQSKDELSFLSKLKIGISTGKNYCGGVGASSRMGYTVLGESVNFAARLMVYTENKTACIDSFTYAKVKNKFETKEIANIELKGIQSKKTVYEIIDEKETVEERIYSERFVGRVSELAVINEKLDNLSRQSSIISLVGDTGVGKTRLGQAIFDTSREKDTWVIKCDCYPYEKYTPFYIWKTIFAELFNLSAKGNDQEKIDQIASTLSQLENVSANWASAFAIIAGIKVKEEDPFTAQLEPKQKNERINEITLLLIQHCASLKNLLIAIDDFHFVDEASFLLLHHVFSHIHANAMLFIMLRPERDIALIEDSPAYEKIKLTEFSDEEAREYANLMLNLQRENPELEKLIVSRSHGNALFIESIVHSLREQKILMATEEGYYKLSGSVRDMIIPDTLHDVLLSRVDQLAEEEQATLKTASVFGRIFAHELITYLTPENISLKLNDCLKSLEVNDFINIEKKEPLTYIFRHILIRDVVYNSLLESTKKDLHKKLAEILEERYKDNLDEVVDSLAYHYLQAEVMDSAAKYCLEAAHKALSKYGNSDAIYYFEKTLEIYYQQGVSESNEQVVNIFEKLAAAYFGLGKFDKAIELYEKCLPHRKSYAKADILAGLGKVYREKGEWGIAIEKFEKAMAILGKKAPKGKVGLYLGIAKNLVVHEINEKLPFTVRKIKSTSKRKKILEQQSLILMNLDKIYYFLDLEKLAWSNFANVIIADKVSENWLYALAYANYGLLQTGLGFFKKAKKSYAKSIHYADQIENPIIKGLAYQRFGMQGMYINEPTEWRKNMEKAVGLFKEVGELFELYISLTATALSHYFESDFVNMAKGYKELRKLAVLHGARVYIAWADLSIPIAEYLLGQTGKEKTITSLLGGIAQARAFNDLAAVSTGWNFLNAVAVRENIPSLCKEYAENGFDDLKKLEFFIPDSHIAYTSIAEAALIALQNNLGSPKEMEKIIQHGLKKLLNWGKTFPYVYGPAHRVYAKFYHYKGKKDQAKSWIKKAIEIHEKGPNLWETGLAYFDAAEIFPEQQEHFLSKAEAIFTEKNITVELRRLNAFREKAKG